VLHSEALLLVGQDHRLLQKGRLTAEAPHALAGGTPHVGVEACDPFPLARLEVDVLAIETLLEPQEVPRQLGLGEAGQFGVFVEEDPARQFGPDRLVVDLLVADEVAEQSENVLDLLTHHGAGRPFDAAPVGGEAPSQRGQAPRTHRRARDASDALLAQETQPRIEEVAEAGILLRGATVQQEDAVGLTADLLAGVPGEGGEAAAQYRGEAFVEVVHVAAELFELQPAHRLLAQQCGRQPQVEAYQLGGQGPGGSGRLLDGFLPRGLRQQHRDLPGLRRHVPSRPAGHGREEFGVPQPESRLAGQHTEIDAGDPILGGFVGLVHEVADLHSLALAPDAQRAAVSQIA
jgi:hypothetical protein